MRAGENHNSKAHDEALTRPIKNPEKNDITFFVASQFSILLIIND